VRVCYVLNQFPELSQTFVLQQVVDLLAQGHEVDVLAARVGTDAAQHAALWHSTNASSARLRTRYTGMPDSLLRRALAGVRLGLPAALKHPKLVATAIDIRRFGWFAATGSLLTMGIPLARERAEYDAIIAHFGPQGMIAQGLREMKVVSGPLATFFHAYDLTSAPRLVGRGIYRRLFERGELQVAISERGAAMLLSLGAPADRIRVHHMGIDVAAFHPLPAPRAPAEQRAGLIVSIGRLIAKKGFDHGLRAIAEARARGVLLEYDIYGSGPLRGQLERTIETLGLRGIARLCGPSSQSELAGVLRNATVLLVPSVTANDGDEEGIPMVLMEGMASETPVVATHCGAVGELVSHEVNGLLVRQADSEGLCAALCRLTTDPALAARLGQAGRERVVSDFNQVEQGRRLVALLAGLSRVPSAVATHAHVGRNPLPPCRGRQC
jgi:colanic acid/amylovoran/stewartan biosynthesis glycosyltransferase WcaL/AmsK/CpsK